MSIKYIFEKYYNYEKPFMTPRVYGFDSVKIDDDRTLLFEKSKGTGLFDTVLYGCSVLLLNPKTHEVRKIDLSKAFDSAKEVNKYIKSITIDNVNDARVYGEVKII